MGLIDLAEDKIIRRGFNYYNKHKVISCVKTGRKTYSGIVLGSSNNEYFVNIDLAQPINSNCDCPYAEGSFVVCKHMIALYFTVKPKAADHLMGDIAGLETGEEDREQERYKKLEKYINRLSKAELRQQLFDALLKVEELRDHW